MVEELLAPAESGAPAVPVPVPVRLDYDAADPFAVHATFRTGSATCVRWV